MSSFDLLSAPIRKYVRDKRWPTLRPIQDAAIARITSTDNNYILVSRTASGKTEAAFLPILSKVNFSKSGVQVLYISPLIALINDQFLRVEELCSYLEVPVTKWHGEANRTLKEKLLKVPEGIVLITPESIEAMFINTPYNVKHLFRNLKFVVIDEIHSFVGTDRGKQLQSLLSRLQEINVSRFTVIGLSATISEANGFIEVKDYTGRPDETKILIDRTSKEINAVFRYFKADKNELPADLITDLYHQTQNTKALIFPNNRGRTEDIAVKLKKLSDRAGGHGNYFSHHSSVDREVREYVEFFAKNNGHRNFAIACTSTLELGIDIGAVDEVIQIDATYSIASLIQRVGRSGRRDDKASNMFLYATNEWSMLQSLACWLLYQDGFIEPPNRGDKSYDLVLHQALSITKGQSGIGVQELISRLKENFAFKEIEINEIEEIIYHLIETDLLEKLGDELIVGVEGEKVVNSREMYSVFSSEENFKVINAGNSIGEVPYSPQIIEDENIFLAAKIWKIKFVDIKTKKVDVIPAVDGKPPLFSGGGGHVNPRIRAKMKSLIFSDEEFDFLDQASKDVLDEMRKGFKVFTLKDIYREIPLLVSEKRAELFTFTGTKINRSLQFLMEIAGHKFSLDDRSSSFLIHSANEFTDIWPQLITHLDRFENVLLDSLQNDNNKVGSFSKWGVYLPKKFQMKLIMDRYYDLDELRSFLNNGYLITNIAAKN